MRSEALFSRKVCAYFTQHGWFHQRIESGTTSVGIPDLYVPALNLWVELKNMPYESVARESWEIKWRKGQQTWAHNFLKATNLCTYTLVCMKDGCVLVPMSKRYERNIVNKSDVIAGTFNAVMGRLL